MKYSLYLSVWSRYQYAYSFFHIPRLLKSLSYRCLSRVMYGKPETQYTQTHRERERAACLCVGALVVLSSQR